MKLTCCLLLCLLFFHKANAQTKTEYSIDGCVQRFMQHLQIPGCAIVILKDDSIVRMKGYGLASLEFNVPVTTKTKFLLDSYTKLFTAIAIMKLQEEGKLKLDNPVNLYLDSIPKAWNKVTIRNLLTHSSGIHDDYVKWYNGSSSMEYTESELYHYALQQPLDFETGSRVSYNNLGFFLATILIGKVTHVPYQDFMTDSLFVPLGLDDISFASQEQVVKNYATAYALDSNDKIVHMRMHAISQQGFSYMMKASVEDLAKFYKLFDAGKVISETSIAEMRKFFITNDHLSGIEELGKQFEGLAYETNFINGYTTYSKGGGAGTIGMEVPGLHLTIIILSNCWQDHVPELALQLARLAEPSLTVHQTIKDPDTSFTNKIKLAFINFSSGSFDSATMNLHFFSLYSPEFYKERKKDIMKLQAFSYAGQQKMYDRNIFISGEHLDRVMICNVKIGRLEFPEYFYLSDNGKILFLSNELYERGYF